MSTFSHALYAMGYHMHDNQKCIIAKSSWCSSTHKEHHIKQDYFASGNVFSPWAIVPKKKMIKKYFINDNGKIGLMILEGFTGTVTFAKDPQALESLKSALEFTGQESTITIP